MQLTSAFKPPIDVTVIEYDGGYARIYHPDHKEPVWVPVDALEERKDVDDLL